MAASREFIHSVSPEELDDTVVNVRVTMEHFEDAMDEVGASVTPEVRERYDEIEERFNQSGVEGETKGEVGRTFQ